MNKLVKSKKMWLAFAIIFISGIVIGVLSGALIMHRSKAKGYGRKMSPILKSRMLMHMTQRLDFDDEQKEQAKTIISLMMKKIYQHQIEQRPIIKAVIDTALSDIEKILTEEQKVKFNKMKAEMSRRRYGKPPGYSGRSGRYGKHRHENSDKLNKTDSPCTQYGTTDVKCQFPPTPPTPSTPSTPSTPPTPEQ